MDLLVSLASVSAKEGVMDDPLPIGMGLRVPLPDFVTPALPPGLGFAGYHAAQPPPVPEIPKNLQPSPDGLVEFDELSGPQVFLY